MSKTMTSATANKMLRQLKDEKDYLLEVESNANTYIETEGVDDTCIPEYDYRATANRLAELDNKVCALKHAINKMNVSTEITVDINGEPETMTIDVALVKMAQLNRRASYLDTMRKMLPKARHKQYGSTSNLVEYICVNYDIKEVKADYDNLMTTIAEIQTQIDYVNQTVQFEVEV